MKKSSLLSLLTAAAIVTTTVGTYAAWDSLETTSSKTVTFRKPVTIEVGTDNEFSGISTLGAEDLSVSRNVSFTIENDADLAKKLKIVPEVTGVDSSYVTISITDDDADDDGISFTGDASQGFIDTSLDSTNYTVKVIPSEEHKDELGGKEITVKLTATLSE